MDIPNFAAQRRMRWVAVALHAPAVLASCGVLVVLAGRFAPLVCAAWLAGAALATARVGERILLRACGFRRASAPGHPLPALGTGACARAGLPSGQIDWYVLPHLTPNAYAVGRHAVAVTAGLLRDRERGRLTDYMVQAILMHELGHLRSTATRNLLALRWLTAPWRCCWRAMLGVCRRAAGGRSGSMPLVGVVVALVIVSALVQAMQRGDWTTFAILCSVAGFGLAVPLFDAAVWRRGERVADRFAAAAGAGGDLAHALEVLTGTRRGHSGTVLDRLLDHHPAERVVALRV